MAPALKKRKTAASTIRTSAVSTANARITSFGRLVKAGGAGGHGSSKNEKNGLLSAERRIEGEKTARTAERNIRSREREVVEVKEDATEKTKSSFQNVLDGKSAVKQARKRAWDGEDAIAVTAEAEEAGRKSAVHQKQGAKHRQEEEAASFSSPALPPKPTTHYQQRQQQQRPLATLQRTATPNKQSRSRDSSPSPIFSDPLSSASTQTSSSPTQTTKAHHHHHHHQSLPSSLLDLVDLHRSFLTALSLHYAHHGALAPVDLRLLLPSIASTWGKRRVDVTDLRRLLGVHDSAGEGEGEGDGEGEGEGESSTLVLTDYGAGRICVERSAAAVDAAASRFRPLDTAGLQNAFVARLRCLAASSACAVEESSGSDNSGSDTTTKTANFISLLPLAPITTASSIAQAAAILTKGQTRLADLRARPSSAAAAASAASTARSTTANTSLAARGTSLLNRLRQKQLKQSTLPAPRTPEATARRAALLRLVDVMPVLEALTVVAAGSSRGIGLSGITTDTSKPGTTSNPNTAASNTATTTTTSAQDHDPHDQLPERPRCLHVEHSFAFTMPALVQALQTSLRTPLARTEAERCVRLLACEIAPAWIAVREVGRVVGVRVRRAGALGREEIERRVRVALDEVVET